MKLLIVGGPFHGQQEEVPNDRIEHGRFWDKIRPIDEFTYAKETHRIEDVRFYKGRRLERKTFYLRHGSLTTEHWHELIKELA